VKTTSLIRANDQTKYIWLDLTTADPGEIIAIGTGEERLVVVLSGRANLTLDGHDAVSIGGRADVFEGPGDAVYLPPASSAALVADPTPGGLTVAVVAAPVSAQEPGPARVIPAGAQRVTVVGTESWGRTVRTILGPDDPASRLLVGETVHNGTGTWSSFPPHRHDRDSADEARLEEVYYYRVDPADGFAVQLRYDTDSGREDLRIVRDGDTAAIPAGFHPVVAAPGHNLYYLWILAGEQRAMRVFVDPRYRWLNDAT
jgi:5-deoxy-glucuronate isomerase